MSLIFQHPHWHSFSQPPPERHFAWGNREGCRRQEGCCLLPSEGQGHCQHALNRYFILFFCESWTLDHKSVSQSQQLARYEKSSSSQLKIQTLLLYIHRTSWWWFMPTWFGWLCLKSFGAGQTECGRVRQYERHMGWHWESVPLVRYWALRLPQVLLKPRKRAAILQCIGGGMLSFDQIYQAFSPIMRNRLLQATSRQ